MVWRSDPERARHVLTEQGEFLARWAPEIRLSYDGVSHGPDDLNFLASLPAGPLRGRLLSLVLASAVDSYSKSSHAEATAFWEDLPRDVKQDIVAAGFGLLTSMLMDFGTYDGVKPLSPFEDEAELFRHHAESSGSASAARDFIRGHGDSWAASDPAAAVSWSLADLKGNNRLSYTASLFEAAAHSDYDRAVAVWQTLPPGVLKARAAGALVAGTSESRMPDALALLDTLSPHDRGIAEEAANIRR